jgi:hypothetical protein
MRRRSLPRIHREPPSTSSIRSRAGGARVTRHLGPFELRADVRTVNRDGKRQAATASQRWGQYASVPRSRSGSGRVRIPYAPSYLAWLHGIRMVPWVMCQECRKCPFACLTPVPTSEFDRLRVRGIRPFRQPRHRRGRIENVWLRRVASKNLTRTEPQGRAIF